MRRYIHRPGWTPTTCHQEIAKTEDRHGLRAHPLAIVDKINRKLLEKGIMPRHGVSQAPAKSCLQESTENV